MFYMPEDKKTPIVMVGPGTGIVPYIGFIEERIHQGGEYGESHLFFGCRKPDSDFIFKNFLEKAQNDKILTNLNTAFSRTENKEYV